VGCEAVIGLALDAVADEHARIGRVAVREHEHEERRQRPSGLM
jgi:hypothetical protein